MRLRNTESAQSNLLDLIDTAEYEAKLKQYRQLFARDHQGPYATQQPGRPWRTKYKPVSDPLLKAHLSGLYWVALKASWYPRAYIIDVDAPGSDKLTRIIETLGLSEGQYMLTTSPSYKKDGSLHIIIALTYRDRLPTHKLGYTALTNTLGRLCEVYPQLRRKCRLPFGRDQRIISHDGAVLDAMPWWDGVYWTNKLDPVPIETLVFQPSLPFPSLAKDEDNPRKWINLGKAQELYDYGLQATGTRHESQWQVAVVLWRSNWLPEDAIAEVGRWIRKKHNGFSETINKGDWREVDGEIFRQVRWIWTNFRPYPDTPHNLDGFITEADLRWIAEVYRADAVNQKRLFDLVCYIRPRAHNEFVYVPYHVWRDQIAHKDTYHKFIADLESKGLLDSVMKWRHVEGRPEDSYSRKFRLHLPACAGEPIQQDGRNEHDYYEALRLGIGSIRGMAVLTGIRPDMLRRAFARQGATENKEN